MSPLVSDLGRGRDRYLSLLISLVVLLAAYPVVKQLGTQKIYGVLLAAQLIISAYSIGESARHLWTAMVLCIPGFGLQLLSAARPPTRATMLMADVASLVFLGYVIVVIYRGVLSKASTGENAVAGAISVYLLIGIFWSVLYNVIAILQPGSFSDFEMEMVDGLVRYAGGADFLYFSFVTLTTLGYGDMSPDLPLAQAAAWAEAVAGQLFVAVTIASLVAARVAEAQERARRRRRDQKGDNSD